MGIPKGELTMTDYEKLEAIHSLLLNYLDDEEASMDDIGDALYLVEEVREHCLKESLQ